MRDLTIGWCGDARRSEELAAFFVQNVSPDYISHSELQGSRALSPTQWRDGLLDILSGEIGLRLAKTGEEIPGRTSQPILVAETDGLLVGLSLVTFSGKAGVPFAIVEDLIVLPSMRSLGIGRAIMGWIAEEARHRGIGRLFLESGVRNERAHHHFEREGFHIVSVVMMRPL